MRDLSHLYLKLQQSNINSKEYGGLDNMVNISDEAIDRLIEIAGMTGRVLVYVGLICACYMVWRLVFLFI